MSGNEQLIAEAQNRITEWAEGIRAREIESLGPFDSEADRQRARDQLVKTYLWQRIELAESVAKLKAAMVGSLPVVGRRWLARRWNVA